MVIYFYFYFFNFIFNFNRKKELEGLNENQCISKIQGILKELGIEGTPNLKQCKTIKKRREFDAELREIITSNIIEGKRRRGNEASGSGSGKGNEIVRKKMIISESESESDENESHGESIGSEEVLIDLTAFGDSESE